MCTVDYMWVHLQSANTQLSPLYFLSTLYIIHLRNYSRPRPLPLFHTASNRKLGGAWEQG